MSEADQPWRTIAGGLAVRVRVTPKASRDGIEAVEATADGPALKARVRAVPEDGAANRAVAQLVATWLGVPKSAAEVTAGHRSRVKTVTISGDAVQLAQRATARLADTGTLVEDRRRA